MVDNLLSQLSKKTGLTFNQKRNILYGYYNDYCLSIQTFYNVAYIIFPLRLTDYYNFSNMEDFLSKLRTNFSEIESISYKNFNLSIKYNCNTRNNTIILNIISLLNNIIEESIKNKLVSCCPTCGKRTEVDSFLVNKGVILRCNDCISKVKDKIDTSAKYNTNNHTSIKPLIGATLGSLIGVAIWMLLSFLHLYGGISGILIALFAIKGYQIFDGELNKAGLILSSIIAAFMIFTASYLSLGIVYYNKTNPDGIGDAIQNISYWLTYASVKRTFIQELLTGYFFFSIGVLTQIKTTYKLAKYNVRFQQLQ